MPNTQKRSVELQVLAPDHMHEAEPLVPLHCITSLANTVANAVLAIMLALYLASMIVGILSLQELFHRKESGVVTATMFLCSVAIPFDMFATCYLVNRDGRNIGCCYRIHTFSRLVERILLGLYCLRFFICGSLCIVTISSGVPADLAYRVWIAWYVCFNLVLAGALVLFAIGYSIYDYCQNT
jgi:hypothetical protein